MSGQFKPVAFEPYGSRRTRWRLPRWLALLLGGIAIGAGGVVLIQERYLPPRLSTDESAKLRSAFEQTDAERLRLKGELGETAKQLETARAGMKGLQDELAASHATTERLRDDLASVIATLPPDPRGGVIEIRSGRFTVARGTLAYDVVLTRARGTGKPMTGVMQFTVTGESARGAETTVPLKPVDLSIGAHEIARGSLALPDGLTPRQVTIQVLDRIAGNSLGMRVMLVR